MVVTSKIILNSPVVVAAVKRIIAQICPGAKSPADLCTSAYVVPGNSALHAIVINALTANAGSESVGGIPVGHTVWLAVMPPVTGWLTFSTCRPRTTNDTVAQAFRGGNFHTWNLIAGGTTPVVNGVLTN